MAIELEDFMADDAAESTHPQPNSLGPNDPVCVPVMVERERRKKVDRAIFDHLRGLERTTRSSLKFSRLTAGGVGAMVILAALEYAGILGDGHAPIWARAVIDGARFALGLD